MNFVCMRSYCNLIEQSNFLEYSKLLNIDPSLKFIIKLSKNVKFFCKENYNNSINERELIKNV